MVAHDEAELDAARRELEAAGHDVVIEEYVAGPSLSLEVLAWGGRAVPLQVTGLEFDAAYDCKRVVAPVAEVGAGAPAAAGPDASATGTRPSPPASSTRSMPPASASPRVSG